jgi:hypothetical protein
MLADAALVDRGDHYLIYTASGISRGRRNFSAFHEMAHTFFLEASKERKPFLSPAEQELLRSSYQEEERLCNIAATEFLLPTDPFQENLRDMEISWESIRFLATRFEASLEATARRVGEFYEGPLLIARWKMSGGNLQSSVIVCSRDLKWFSDKIKDGPPPLSVVAAFDACANRTDSVRLFLKGHHVPFRVELRYNERSQEVLGLYST